MKKLAILNRSSRKSENMGFKKVLKYYDFSLPVIISLAYFLASNGIIHPALYLIFAIPISIYYLIIKSVVSILPKNPYLRVIEITGNLVIYLLITMSMVNLHFVNSSVSNIAGVTGILNFCFMIYYITIENRKNSIIHALFLLLVIIGAV